ncbi:MAG TPA: alpha/beta hydrolase [Geminicoccaceae bacterium]|nr:alpha/beta hydrolase [Geminicoccus sp.]HMU48234.1 alpha/beta hydrolase [Geminicoccaceae bacterium]
MWRSVVIPAPGSATGRLRLGLAGMDGVRRGTLVVLPGRAEFIEKYEEAAADFCRRGFAVAVVEWRGQGLSLRGQSMPQRGFVGDYEEYLQDLAAVLGELRSLAAPVPWIVLGHSMGGHIALRWLYREPGTFAAAVMTAPMFGIPLAGVPEPMARLLCSAAVRLGRGHDYAPGQGDFSVERCRYEGNPLTSCPGRFETYRGLVAGRPDLIVGGATWGWLDASLRSIAITRRPGYLESIETPILLCLATEERVVSNAAIAMFARRLPNARLERFAGARHELLIERDAIRDRVLAAIDAFLDPAAPPLSPARAAEPQPA